MPRPHLQTVIRFGEFDAFVAVKTSLRWVLISGKRSNLVNTNIVSTNKLNINYDDGLNKQAEKFCPVESVETV